MAGRVNRARDRAFTALTALIAVGAAVLAFVPLPYPTTQQDRTEALDIALKGLVHGEPVPTSDGPRPLQELNFVHLSPGHAYFVNQAGVSDDVFLRYGFKPVPKGVKPDVDHGDVVVYASLLDHRGEATRYLQFSYVFGSLGAHGYEIQVRRNLWHRTIVLASSWVS